MTTRPLILLLLWGPLGFSQMPEHDASAVDRQRQEVAGEHNPAPDLLRDIGSHSAMSLTEFEQLALGNNPTLRQAEALVRQSAAQAKQAGLYPNPSVGYQGEQIRGGVYRGGEQGVFVQQTFVLGGKLGLRRNVYEQQRRGDEIGVSEQRYRVLSDVRQCFYTLLAAQEMVNVRRRLVSLANDAVQTAHQLANVGQADAPDVLQAEVEAEQATVDVTAAQRTYIQSFRALAALAGKPELSVSPVKGDLEHPPQIDGDQIVSQLLNESPSVKRAQQETVRAQAELKSAKRESIPDLQIHAGVQQNFESITEGSRLAVGLQAFTTASITLPVFNRNQGNVAAARADIERAQADVSRIQLSLRQEAQPLLERYRSNLVQADRYRTAMIPRAAKAYQLYLAKYQSMAAAYPQVLVSQRTYFQLQAGYISTLESLWSDSIMLQHFLLSSGLDAPVASGNPTTTLNLPSANGSGGSQ